MHPLPSEVPSAQPSCAVAALAVLLPPGPEPSFDGASFGFIARRAQLHMDSAHY